MNNSYDPEKNGGAILLDKLTQVINPQDNGGESITLITTFFDNGDKAMFRNQEISLQSYANSASIQLFGALIDSKLLYKMAREMESKEIELRLMLQGQRNG